MMNYEKPMLEVVSLQEEEKLMLDLHGARDDELTLNGIIGYSIGPNSQAV